MHATPQNGKQQGKKPFLIYLLLPSSAFWRIFYVNHEYFPNKDDIHSMAIAGYVRCAPTHTERTGATFMHRCYSCAYTKKIQCSQWHSMVFDSTMFICVHKYIVLEHLTVDTEYVLTVSEHLFCCG